MPKSINNLFGIEKFNLIQDDENYYFFRSLEDGDITDIQKWIIIDDNGNFLRLRTDRVRYVENQTDKAPIYSDDEQISLQQVKDHIKKNYRPDTNCISFSSNANVAIDYGRSMFSERYVLIRIPKDEMGDKVFHAGEYMLSEIASRIQETVSHMYSDEGKYQSILETIKKIDEAQDSKELVEIVAESYKINAKKMIANFSGKIYTPNSDDEERLPLRTRFSSYASLEEEQNVGKNRLVAKLTLLEHLKIMQPIIPHTLSNSRLLQTVGMAFSSSEIIHYGEILGEKIVEVPKEFMSMLALLQQQKEKTPDSSETISQIENEIIGKAIQGYKVSERDGEVVASSGRDEIVLGFPDFDIEREKEPTDLSLKEAYDLTGGRLTYEDVNTTLRKVFYLSRAITNAKVYARFIENITPKNPSYKEIIGNIQRTGFDIESDIIDRKSSSNYRISEAVSINVKKYEAGLIELIQSLSQEELQSIINGDSELSKYIFQNLPNVQEMAPIFKNEYYTRAVFSMYDWKKGNIKFTESQKETFIQKLQERNIASMFETLAKVNIPEAQIATILLNLSITDNAEYQELMAHLENDALTENDISYILSENSGLKNPIEVEQIEDYIELYKVEGTDIKLRDYQKTAIDKANEIFETRKFASVILPTGAGKSFVAIAELMQMQANLKPGEKMLYLAPSNEILDQIASYVEKNVVGSSLGKTKEEILKEVFPNLELATYQSLLLKSDEELQNSKYGFIVLDELHRTGAKEWGKKLDILLTSQEISTKALGITATPERDVDGKNMADEIALKLGYSEDEIENKEHIAMNMNLIDAIRLGIVVNPKVVECEYNLKQDKETWESLLDRINSIENEEERKKYLEKYDKLRKSLENAQEIPELLRDNITKKDGRYIFFMPVGENGDEVSGEERIKKAKEQLREWLKYIDAEPEFYSMLGKYSDKKNAEELSGFESSKSNHVKIMIVMNKLNEGVHVDGVDGIIWQRALDEDSRILLLQQLGRVIYSPNEERKERPIVIDLPNNLTRVDLDKVINTYTEADDRALLINILDWMHAHGEVLPDINSGSKEEARMASTLKRIQEKYIGYIRDNEKYEKLDAKKKNNVEVILELGNEIDLWDLNLPDKIKKLKNGTKIGGQGIDDVDFALSGLMKDFVDLSDEIDKLGLPILLINARKIREWMDKQEDVTKPPRQRSEKLEEKKLGKARNVIKQRLLKRIWGVPNRRRKRKVFIRFGMQKSGAYYKTTIWRNKTNNGWNR